jgi:hypothetical protein
MSSDGSTQLFTATGTHEAFVAIASASFNEVVANMVPLWDRM